MLNKALVLQVYKITSATQQPKNPLFTNVYMMMDMFL